MSKPCPTCGYDLSGTIASGLWRCPECDFAFKARDLEALFGPVDPRGAPATLSPYEWRMSGTWIIALMVLALAAFAIGVPIIVAWLQQP
jgi:uncharacterized paraquat-inducible protein A